MQSVKSIKSIITSGYAESLDHSVVKGAQTAGAGWGGTVEERGQVVRLDRPLSASCKFPATANGGRQPT
jgi:hypothetical protein